MSQDTVININHDMHIKNHNTMNADAFCRRRYMKDFYADVVVTYLCRRVKFPTPKHIENIERFLDGVRSLNVDDNPDVTSFIDHTRDTWMKLNKDALNNWTEISTDEYEEYVINIGTHNEKIYNIIKHLFRSEGEYYAAKYDDTRFIKLQEEINQLKEIVRNKDKEIIRYRELLAENNIKF